MAGERRLPGNGLWGFWTAGTNGWKAGMDENLVNLSVLVQGSVLSRTATVPASPADGAIYIVPNNSADTANRRKIAVRDNGAWTYITPREGLRLRVLDTDEFAFFDGTNWINEAEGTTYSFLALDGAPPEYGTAGQVLAVNSLGTGLVFVTPASGGGGGGGDGIADAPLDGVIYGRKDGAWIAVPEGGGGSGGTGATKAGPHRYWRIRPLATASGGREDYTHLIELSFRETVDGPSLTGTAIESGHYATQVPAFAFDGNTATYWESQQGGSIAAGTIWLGLDLGSAKSVAQFQIRAGEATVSGEIASLVGIEYSDDGSAWTSAQIFPTGFTTASRNAVFTGAMDAEPLFLAGEGITTVKKITGAAYDALAEKDPEVLYVVDGVVRASSGGGGGGTVLSTGRLFGDRETRSGAVTFSSGFVGVTRVLVPTGETLDTVSFASGAAVTDTATARAVVYAESSPTVPTTLLAQSALVTLGAQAAAADFSVPLTTPYVGTGVYVWIGFVFGENVQVLGRAGNDRYWSNGGTTAPNPAAGSSALGSGWVMWGDGRKVDADASKVDYVASLPGAPGASGVVLSALMSRPVTFAKDFAGSFAVSSAAATASTVLNVVRTRAGVSVNIGTVTFAAASKAGVFKMGSQHVTQAGDVIEVVAPGTADSALAGIKVALVGIR